MNRLERVIETLRAALNTLATVVPAWVQATVPVTWLERYALRAEDARFPQQEAERTAYADMVGCDGYALFAALYSATAPPWLRELPAVETLRRVWLQNFLPLYEGGARWGDKADLPPGAQYINSPYDPEAHYAKKRAHTWLGYKVHLTEACDDDLPHLMTNVHTTAAPTGDNDALPAMHTALAQAELLPSTHLVDTGYVEAKRLIESRETHGVDLFGPTPGNHRWQFQQGRGFDLSASRSTGRPNRLLARVASTVPIGGQRSITAAMRWSISRLRNPTVAPVHISRSVRRRRANDGPSVSACNPYMKPYKRRDSGHRRRSLKNTIRSARGSSARSRKGCGRSGCGARAILGRRKPPCNISLLWSPSTWYGLAHGGRA